MNDLLSFKKNLQKNESLKVCKWTLVCLISLKALHDMAYAYTGFPVLL